MGKRAPLKKSPVLSTAECVATACRLEVSAPKPGNVNRGHDFPDLTYRDFLAGAAAIAPVMARATRRPLGLTVLDAVRATRRVVPSNANLGTVLLLAPLATVPRPRPLAEGVARVLADLQPGDAARVYEAIRLAHAGGLGRTRQHDVQGPAPADLLDAMRLAADHDQIARQYAQAFRPLLAEVVPLLRSELAEPCGTEDAIVRAQMQLMARWPDSLIARKCGVEIARQAAERAAAVLRAGLPGEPAYQAALADLDGWLRTDGNRRNPGTTADLLAAGLFVLLREGWSPNTAGV